MHLAPLSRRSGRQLGLSANPRQGLIGSSERYQTLGVALGNDHDPRRSCRFANHFLPELRAPREVVTQVLVAVGICLLLTDAFSLQTATIPFTETRVPRNTTWVLSFCATLSFFLL